MLYRKKHFEKSRVENDITEVMASSADASYKTLMEVGLKLFEKIIVD